MEMNWALRAEIFATVDSQEVRDLLAEDKRLNGTMLSYDREIDRIQRLKESLQDRTDCIDLQLNQEAADLLAELTEEEQAALKAAAEAELRCRYSGGPSREDFHADL